MNKQLLLFLLLITSLSAFSQEIDRFTISGKITASKGDDVEGINIYNKSSQKGTITSATGEFEIKVAENDRVFIKLKKRRTLFECREKSTGKIYLFSPQSEVKPIYY